MFCRALFVSAVLALSSAASTVVPVVSAVVALNNELALNALQSVSNDENVFISSLLLTQSLVPFLNEENAQMKAALKTSEKVAILLKGFQELNSKNAFKNASLLLSARAEEKEAFVTSAQRLDVRVESVDFNRGKETREKVNAWVAMATGGAVPLLRDSLDADNQLVAIQVANAVFNSSFAKLNEKREFRNFVSDSLPPMATKVPFMARDAAFKAIREDHVVSVEIPISETFSAFLISSASLNSLLENATAADVTALITRTMAAKAREMRLILPQMRIECELDLKELFFDLEIPSKLSFGFQRNVFELKADPKAELTPKAKGEELVVADPFILVLRDADSGVWRGVARVQSIVDEELLSFQFI